MLHEMTGRQTAGLRKMRMLAVAVSMAFALVGGEYYVDCGVPASGTGAADSPFKTIQEAIAAAEAGSTIHVAAGTYDSGSTQCADTGYARVRVTKSLTIKGAGRDKSFIVGAKGSGTAGLGTGAVRCVAIEADDVEISGFTICNGHTTGTSASSASGMGGGVYSNNKSNGFVVDCTIRNCVAAKGGAIARMDPNMSSEGLAAVRCMITDNKASSSNQVWCDYGASLYWCIITRHYNAGCSPIYSAPKVINCTFDNNYAHHYFQGCVTICNTFAGRYSYKGGNTDGNFTNVYFTSVSAGNMAAKSYSSCTFSGEEKQFVSPLMNDLRPIPSAAVLTAGNGELLAHIPETYRTKDYEGTTVDPSSATIAVGAIQTPCAPASGMTVFAMSGILDGDRLVFNGVTNSWYQQQYYWHTTNWPSFARFKPLFKGNTNDFGFTASGADSMDRFPLMDGTYLVMPSPSAALTLTMKKTVQTLYADPNADASLADGTAEHPFATLQDAADAVASGGYAVIYAARGTYRTGGSSVIGGLNNRVAFQGRHIRLVGVEGAENTVIEGARDPDAGDDVYGCGANATRCLCASASGAVQGFTLTGGHAGTGSAESDVNRSGAVLATAAFQVLDCIVSSNFAGRAAAGHGSTSHLLFSRSKIIGNRTISTGGSGAYTLASDFTSCLIANNWCGNVEAPVLGVGQSEQVYDCTVYSEGENSNFSGYGANANSGTHRNSIFMGFGAYRNKEVYGIVIDTKILNSTKTTYVTTLTGDYKSGKGFVQFVDAVNGDFRLLPTSPAVGYASYSASTHAAAYRLATMSLDGVVPDFSGDGAFPAGAYRKVAPVLAVSGEGISPASVTVDPAPGTTVSVTATLAHERPFLGFAVNGALQPFAGTGFTYTVPAGGLEEPVTITAVYDSHWYVDAVNGRDDGYGTSTSPLRRLCDALNYQRSGDTVHVAPGEYGDGTMRQAASFAGSAAKTASRAVVASGVTLVSDEGADSTFIVGAPDTENETVAGYGDGPDAVRCVAVYGGGTVRGFTLTGGRTSFSNGAINDSSCGGAALCENGNACVEDCVISNCIALVSGGGYKGTYRRCKFIDCWTSPTGNSPAARYAHLFNCYVNGCRGGWTVADMYRIHSCTIGPDNTNASGGAVDTLYRMAAGATVNNCLLFGRVTQHAGSGTAYSNCIFNVAFTFSDTNFTTNNCRFVPTADFALDEDGRPAIGSSVAIDAGDATIYDADLLGDFDCEGKPRFVNGLKLDVGAFEADWKARYSKVLGGRGVEVTDADPAAEERGDGVFLPDGTLALNWASGTGRGKRYQFDVSVSGTGTLTVLLNGEPYRSYTAASGAVSEAIVSEAASFTLEFAYTPGTNDNGGATLSHFQDFAGTMLIFR